jgi:hypothetical protein
MHWKALKTSMGTTAPSPALRKSSTNYKRFNHSFLTDDNWLTRYIISFTWMDTPINTRLLQLP